MSRVSADRGGLRVKAYAGPTGVLLAFDVTARAREGLLGFAIAERRGERGWSYLPTSLPWAADPGRRGPGRFTSRTHPIQKFRWSDYGVEPGRRYEYRVQTAHGDWRKPDLGEGVTITVTTPERLPNGDVVRFTRAAAASQAFSRSFPEVERDLKAAREEGRPFELPADARAWLSRGVLDEILAFIDAAGGGGWRLSVAIYEFELPEVQAAIQSAAARGVQVEVLYHAKNRDPQTEENERHLVRISGARPRRTSGIFHHKFIVRSVRDDAGGWRPDAVLTGSTNLTENGVYRQANVLHITSDPVIGAEYLRRFDAMYGGDDVSATRRAINRDNAVPSPPIARWAGFSPRSGLADLEAFIDVVNGAGSDVLFATAFGLHKPLMEALLGAPGDAILRFGLQNTRSSITGYHRDRSANYVATAMLNQGLEGFLKESTAGQRGRLLVHTKVLIRDFTTDDPVVISGSHNLSRPASEKNDENYLVIRGDTDTADAYGIELLRLYDHYRFRWATRPTRAGIPRLVPSDAWTDRYFGDGLPALDRRRFAGMP